MSRDTTLRRVRRRPRAAVMVPLLSGLILVLGWSVLWGVARWQADAALDTVLATEAAHGRVWTCPDRNVSGYPFRIVVACRDVGFAGTLDGSPAEGHLAGLSVWTWVHQLNSVYAAFDGPLTLTTADGRGSGTLAWERLGAKLRGVFGERRRIEVVGEGFALARPDGAGGTARRVELRAGPAVAPAASDADTVELVLTGAAVPALDAVTGEGAPIDGQFSGVVTRAYGDLPDLGPATVERWRRAGGRLDIANLALTKGPLSLGAAGVLALDAQHRVAGRLDARFGGFEPLAKRFGLPLQAVQVSGILAGLLGSKPPPPPAGAPGGVALPVAFADGTVAVGPIKTGLRLPPLY